MTFSALTVPPLVLVGQAGADRWMSVIHSVPGKHLIQSLTGLLLIFLIFVPLERLFTLRPARIFRSQFWADAGFYIVNRALSTFVIAIPFALLAWLLTSLLPLDGLHQWVGSLPFWIKLTVGLLIGEIGAYWAHRLLHEIPSLWRFHVIHHAAEEMDWLVNARVHPVEVVFMRMFQFVPLYTLGLIDRNLSQPDSLWIAFLVPFIGAAWGNFIHANIRLRFGPLEWMVTTPVFHHWHHTNDHPSLYNKNYSSILPLCDLLFGSFYLPKAQRTRSFGVNEPVPKSFRGLLAHPFRNPERSVLIQRRQSAAAPPQVPAAAGTPFQMDSNLSPSLENAAEVVKTGDNASTPQSPPPPR